MKKITLLTFLFGLQLSVVAQDNCATAIPVTIGINTVTEINGTETPIINCTSNNTGSAAEWYVYTPTVNKTVTVTTDLAINVCKDTRIQILSGNCSELICVAGNDDGGDIPCPTDGNNSYLSVVSFNAFVGNTYYIAFDNQWDSRGFDFQFIEENIVVSPVNFTTTAISTSSNICCVVDMNNDYKDDIVTVQNNQMTVSTQNSTGGFTDTIHPLPFLSAYPSWSIASGDFDRNGFNDLVFGSGDRVAVIKANETGTTFAEIPYPQSIFTQRTNFVDINNDGNLDLWACHDVAQSHAYRNDGAGNLVFDISLMPTLAVGGNYATMWTDYNNDGKIDMYLAKCRGGAPIGDPQRINLLYKNNGDGTFSEVGATAGVNDGAQSWSTAIEDFDNDGDFDFLLSNISDQNKFYRNNGDGTFTDIYATTGIESTVGSWEIQAADFNNDGWVDFLWQNSKELYINNGDMTFTGYDLPFNEGALGDLNDDGFLDVQIGNLVYYNTPNQNNWLTVTLQGIGSNRNGIAAKVEVFGTWGKQTREIRSGQGFSHMSSLNAHFGIGEATEITSVVIKWPSGIVDTIDNVTLNQRLHVVEGSSLGVINPSNSIFSIYPNPVKNEISIQQNSNNNIEFKTAEVFDLTGKKVFSSVVNFDKISIIETLSSGTYILLLRDNNGKEFSQKFIKE